MKWTVSLVPVESLAQAWPIVEPMLNPAIARSSGRVDTESVKNWLTEERYRLWLSVSPEGEVKAAFVTRAAVYPRRKMLSVDICGGSSMRSWAAEATRVFQSYARDCGLDGVEMSGRSGWSRALKSIGWKTSMVLCEIAAADEQ